MRRQITKLQHRLCAILACVFLFASDAVRAELRGEVAVANDYVRRGFSLSREDLVLQAGVGYRGKHGLVLGLWGSTVDFEADQDAPKSREVELRAHLGYSMSWGDQWSSSAVLVRYEYPDAEARYDTAYTEGTVSVVFRDVAQLSLSYSDGYLGSPLAGLFSELSWTIPLPLGIDLGLGLGAAQLSRDVDFAYGHAVLTRSWRRLSLDVGHYLSDAPEIIRWGDAFESRWIFALRTEFP